ncbi:hypothetical protein GYMLUDRAFT_251816 [Collybiopsis luxurians FD-317 M1]|uniref:Uncharacterized protein n=1 Tax=Collybiopsis luxurians FD-317 M1 TaxID=944289 RepID=A0A0D0C1S6_9AGAR|nr:hypothetical protein GYMLUDRAFT_251816 [Collybiopsis luxurians FD-317 M1]
MNSVEFYLADSKTPSNECVPFLPGDQGAFRYARRFKRAIFIVHFASLPIITIYPFNPHLPRSLSSGGELPMTITTLKTMPHGDTITSNTYLAVRHVRRYSRSQHSSDSYTTVKSRPHALNIVYTVSDGEDPTLVNIFLPRAEFHSRTFASKLIATRIEGPFPDPPNFTAPETFDADSSATLTLRRL